MPIYEYRCQQCGQQFEKFVRSSSDQNKVECPYCHSTQVKKEFSVFGLGSSNKGLGLNTSTPTPSCNTGST
ncbi:MAG: zinc ribbon domain-containing protein [Anaerolineae bacterium]|nr:zinc ribbon domain-containing protein [Anaerolineae bacterium]